MAQQVATDDRIDAWPVLDLLGKLVDKSLVVAEGEDTARATACWNRARLCARAAGRGRRVGVVARASRPRRAVRRQPLRGRALDRAHRGAFRGARENELRAAVDWALSPGGDRGLAYALLGARAGACSRSAEPSTRACATWWRRGRRRAAWRLRSRPRTAWRSCEAAVPRRRTSPALRAACARPVPRILPDTERCAKAVMALANLLIARGQYLDRRRRPSREAESLLGPGTSWRQQGMLGVVLEGQLGTALR